MSAEKLTNKAIVLETGGRTAKVCMISEDACKHCTSIFCNAQAQEENENVFEAYNNVHAKKGDRVTVQIDGSSLFKASALLYVIPLMLLVMVLTAGVSLFPNKPNVELFSFLASLGILAVYYMGLSIYGKNKPVSKNLPEIISMDSEMAKFPKEMKN